MFSITSKRAASAQSRLVPSRTPGTDTFQNGIRKASRNGRPGCDRGAFLHPRISRSGKRYVPEWYPKSEPKWPSGVRLRSIFASRKFAFRETIRSIMVSEKRSDMVGGRGFRQFNDPVFEPIGSRKRDFWMTAMGGMGGWRGGVLAFVFISCLGIVDFVVIFPTI